MLEQLARDVTGWPARVVEFFQLHRHHPVHEPPAPAGSLHGGAPRLGAARAPRHGLRRPPPHRRRASHLDRRPAATTFPTSAIFLWRLQAYRLEDSVAIPVAAGDQQRFLVSPLGNDAPLFSRPEREAQLTHLAEPVNVPMPISRRVLDASLGTYYGSSLVVKDNGTVVPQAAVHVCDLRDAGGAWASQPPAGIAIDPVLGRIAFAQPPGAGGARRVSVTFHYGFSADMGGGPYERGAALGGFTPPQALIRVPDGQPTIGAALGALPPAGGIVEITDNGRYEETIQLSVTANASIEIRAVNGRRPTLVLLAPLRITGGTDATASSTGC